MNFKIIFLISCATLLSSCALMSPVPNEQDNTFEISTLPHVMPDYYHSAETILILEPNGNPIYDSTDIAYTLRPFQIAYFAKNHWAATPSVMIQQLMVKTLENTRHFKAVVAPPFVGKYDLVLNTQLVELQQDFTVCPSEIHLTFRAELSRTSTNRTIAMKEFSVVEPALQDSPYGGVYATNLAVAKVLDELAQFVMQKTR